MIMIMIGAVTLSTFVRNQGMQGTKANPRHAVVAILY